MGLPLEKLKGGEGTISERTHFKIKEVLKVYKVVIVGAGFISKIHANAYKNLKDVEIKGFYDVNSKKGKDTAKEFNVSFYNEYDSVLDDDLVDIIDICVPTFFHKKVAIRALKAGKNVLCEKPIALNLRDVDDIVNEAGKAKGKFMVTHNHRFQVENVMCKETADSGKIGKILFCSSYRLGIRPDWSEGNWMNDPKLSGGAATDFILHDIDFCNWIGGKPIMVMAQGIKSKTEAWDYMDISINYESGIKGFVEGGWMFKGEFPFTQEVRILGDKGAVDWISRAEKNIEKRAQAASRVAVYLEGQSAKYPEIQKKDAYEIEIGYFIECLKNDKPIEVVKPMDARRALEVSLAAKQSAETGKAIRLN